MVGNSHRIKFFFHLERKNRSRKFRFKIELSAVQLDTSMPIDPVKLAKLQNNKLSKVGGTRRKNLKLKNSNNDNKKSFEPKLSKQLDKLDCFEIKDVAEVNFFQEDGKILHFDPVDRAVMSPGHNLTALVGTATWEKLEDCYERVLPQLGPEAIEAMAQLNAKIEEFERLEKGDNPKLNASEQLQEI